MKISKLYIILIILSLLAGAAIARELFPREVDVVVRIPEPVLVDISDSTQANYEEKVAALEAMNGRLDRIIRELANRPPVVTAETTFVDRPTEVPVTDTLPPRWRLVDLVAGQNVDESTMVSMERYSSDGESLVILPQLEQHVTIGPLLGAFPNDDGSGYRLEFGDWPRDRSCGFGCTLKHVALGAVVGAGATGLACAFLGGDTDVIIRDGPSGEDY